MTAWIMWWYKYTSIILCSSRSPYRAGSILQPYALWILYYIWQCIQRRLGARPEWLVLVFGLSHIVSRRIYVANEGLGLYIGGDYSWHLKCYVTCTICQQTSCHVNTCDDNVTLDMRTRIRPADWCAAARSLPADRKPALLAWQLARSYHQERTYLWMWELTVDYVKC